MVALGGNALAPAGERADIHVQFAHTRESLSAVVALAQEGWHIAIVHGNAPQVGDALVRNELARERVEPLPLGVLVASTAGWIGYMIQQSLQNALHKLGIEREVLTVITQTQVERGGALGEPTKHIGHALEAEVVERLRKRGVAVGQDGGGHWRRLAPSPVVDKDRVAAILGSRLGADTLLILTNVDAVYRGWGTPRAEPLSRLSVDAAEELLEGAELGMGSMRPKVEAAVAFVRDGGGRAVIADLPDGLAAIRGEAGTTITGAME